MGEVFLADHLGANPHQGSPAPQVALKRILPHLVAERDFVDRFVDEARLMIRLRHPNLLPVYELRRDHWGLYMVMEYSKGYDIRTLNRRIKSQGQIWPPEVAVWVIREVCEGLSYAHQQKDEDGVSLGLVHRDVSPSNILLSEEGHVQLIDFGVARAQGGIHQSISGALQGKLAYMSPEQARGEEASPQSDLFSLGLTLYEMLSGKRPREGMSDAEMLQAAQSTQDIMLERDWPGGDSKLIKLVNQVTSHAKNERPDDADELSKRLTSWLKTSTQTTSIERLVSEWLEQISITESHLESSLSQSSETPSWDINQADKS